MFTVIVTAKYVCRFSFFSFRHLRLCVTIITLRRILQEHSYQLICTKHSTVFFMSSCVSCINSLGSENILYVCLKP